MAKRSINEVKERYKRRIQEKADGAHTKMLIFNGRLFTDYCFARMFRRVREHSHKFESFQFILYFDRKLNLFDYDSLHKELKKLFADYFHIIRYFSGKRKVRLISFDAKKKITPWQLWWFAIYLASCMLRLTDKVFERRWKEYFAESGRKNPICTWNELIYLFHRHVYSPNVGYEINEKMARVGLRARGDHEGEIELKALVEDFLSKIQVVFGDGKKITKEMIEYINKKNLNQKYQTAVFDIVSTLANWKEGN